MSLSFLITSLVIAAIPGTGAVYTLSESISRGTRAGMVAAFGCTLGIIPHLAAAVTGLASLLYASHEAFLILKYAGVVYLVFLAIQMWRDDGSLMISQEADKTPVLQVIRRAVLINLLNPKLTIFFFAFLPQFIPQNSSNTFFRMIFLGFVFMVVTFVVFAAYCLAAVRIRHLIVSRPAVLRAVTKTFAVSFLALSARLALASK
ncbi:LysE family translocator [Luteipulveratus halotolerans]|uniref:Lysine transporter LysE n=1 Tax=Luteipulveratus halotolerans TaxID=1631356 RepID=A0A0L6CM35_9MICO|nr:LysE family translocator [Luteipulveratus halotolerans]KNX38794.1 lysine transporter LysE [Luteipulveratus halotolerans]